MTQTQQSKHVRQSEPVLIGSLVSTYQYALGEVVLMSRSVDAREGCRFEAHSRPDAYFHSHYIRANIDSIRGMRNQFDVDLVSH